MPNLDPKVVESFGQEWQRFDHSETAEAEQKAIFESYFADFPWNDLPPNATGFDLGCGSGRWAVFVARRVGVLHCIDPSEAALAVARRKLTDQSNCRFHLASVDAIPLPDASSDFGYSLGVLHHIPDTEKGLAQCILKLKPGAPFLLYLYYAFDKRPWWFRRLWQFSNLGRIAISRLPFRLKSICCDILAALIYWPLARFSRLLERMGANVTSFPLSAYRDRSFYQMRNDSLDRFGTRLERRFTKAEMQSMMEQCGLERIRFREFPCWCAFGYKRPA
jgi:ubiquinone/menaquinone biosynthesis C-methylase UbiE